MTAQVQAVLLLLCLFQVKHMLADFFLQTPKMLEGRDSYLHAGRARHALVHAAGSVLCFWIVGTPLLFTGLAVAAEWLAHFHIDWGKARHSEARDHGPRDAGFWRAVGFDQALHQLTYIALTAAWAIATGA